MFSENIKYGVSLRPTPWTCGHRAQAALARLELELSENPGEFGLDMWLDISHVHTEFLNDRAPHLRTVEAGQGVEFLRREALEHGLHHDEAHTVRPDECAHQPDGFITLSLGSQRSKLADAIGDNLGRRHCRKVLLGGDPPVLQRVRHALAVG